MIRILQINIHRIATAHQLLAQFAEEVNADLVRKSEQYRNKDPSAFEFGTTFVFLPKAGGNEFV